MEASITLGRIRGITIGIHFTWLFVFGLLTFSLATGFFPELYPGWTTAPYWLLGAIASLLLFASVLAHELGHSFVAQARGIPVRSITLFIFGGVATITKESERARDEFQIAIAGPAVSLVIGLVSVGLWVLTDGVSRYLAAVFEYLGLANLILVAFNLIPGYPLDGGRVFRAIVWGITGDMRKSTRIASVLGVTIGYLFIAGGIAAVFLVDTISGIWFIAIGWFLQNAAEQSYRQLALEQTFRGVQVNALMDPDPVTVDPEITIDDLVDHYLLARNVRGAPVVRDGYLVGIITLTDIRTTPRSAWAVERVRDRMTPRDRLVTVTPETGLDVALQAMSSRDVHQLPVVRGDTLVGLLTRAGVIRYLQLRQELPGGGKARPEPTSADRSANPAD